MLVKRVNGGLIFSASVVLVLLSSYLDGYYLKQFLIYQVYQRYSCFGYAEEVFLTIVEVVATMGALILLVIGLHPSKA